MAKFKVLRCTTEETYIERKHVKNKQGNNVLIEREVTREISPAAYGHENIKVGDVLEITGHLAAKARRNPDFEEVSDTGAVIPRKVADVVAMVKSMDAAALDELAASDDRKGVQAAITKRLKELEELL